jgi:hypothetical protein
VSARVGSVARLSSISWNGDSALVNKKISILLRVCVRLSYAVMLFSAALPTTIFLLFLLMGGKPVCCGGGPDVLEWVYVTCAGVLPFASAYCYFIWPWGPVLVCWLVMVLDLSNAFPLISEASSNNYVYSVEMAFFVAAHLGLISYSILKRFGLWPLGALPVSSDLPSEPLPGETRQVN